MNPYVFYRYYYNTYKMQESNYLHNIAASNI